MTTGRTRLFVLAVGLAIASLLLMGAGTQFDWLVAQKLTITGNATVGDDLTVVDQVTATDVTATDDLIATDDVIALGDGNVTGDMVVGDDLTIGNIVWTVRSTQTVAASELITPTATFMQISAAGAVSAGGIVAGAAGQRLTLLNSSTNAITLVDTGDLVLAGNVVLGQYDTVELISDGIRWIQISTSNN
jgi:hypothetical protein